MLSYLGTVGDRVVSADKDKDLPSAPSNPEASEDEEKKPSSPSQNRLEDLGPDVPFLQKVDAF